MMRLRNALRFTSRSCRNSLCAERGQGMAEYIIIVIVVALLVLLGLRYFGSGVGNQFSDAKSKIDVAGSADTDELRAGGGGDSSSGSSSADSLDSVEKKGVSEESLEAPSSDGFGDSGAGESQDIGTVADAISAGVGDSEVLAPPIRISAGSLITILVIAMAFGGFLIMRFARKKDKVIGKKKKKKKQSFFATKDEGGQAMVELVLSVVTFLFCVLGVIQLALCLNAYALVRYAAYNAARAGIVHEADLGQMREAARQSLLAIFPRHGRADHQLGITENYLGALATDQLPLPLYNFRAITNVRIINLDDFASDSVITFDDPAQAPDALLTAEVTHHYELVVPLVNRIAYFLHRRWRQSFKTAAFGNDSVDKLAAETDRERRGGNLEDIEYRIPIVAHYTMRMQSDLVVP